MVEKVAAGTHPEKLIKNNCYQVFLFTCPANIPLNFAIHPWFVINSPSTTSRWEVLVRNEVRPPCWGHLHKDILPPFEGISILPFPGGPRWRVRLLGSIEGGKDSLAHRMAEFVEHSKDTYPHRYRYSLTGPNSNTYIQWVLNYFPESGLKLPWNAFGKHH